MEYEKIKECAMLELNKIYCSDSFEIVNQIDDKSIDMILEDMPYNITACDWDVKIDLEKYWESRKRIIKDNGAIVLFGSEPFSSALRMSNIKNYRYDWVWKKNIPSGFQLATIQPQRCIENILVFYKKQPVYNKQMRDTIIDYRRVINGSEVKDKKKSEHNFGTKPQKAERRETKDLKVNPVNFLDIKCVPRATGYLHPTQKPVELFSYLIKTYTNENDLVFDGFLGSGTTAIACKQLNRNFIGIEKEQKYFDIAEKRLQQETLKFDNYSNIRNSDAFTELEL